MVCPAPGLHVMADVWIKTQRDRICHWHTASNKTIRYIVYKTCIRQTWFNDSVINMTKTASKTVHSTLIADKLEAEIVSGHLLPGTKLDEKSLTERFSVSRTPVREALHVVVSRSLAERLPYRGVVVKDVSAQRIRSMFEAMAEVEALCGRLAAKRMTDLELEKLEEHHRYMEKLVLQSAYSEYEEANTIFHSMIFQGTHNEDIKIVAEDIRLKLAPFRKKQLRTKERLKRSNEDHELILALLKKRNTSGIQEALRDHLQGAMNAMLATRH